MRGSLFFLFALFSFSASAVEPSGLPKNATLIGTLHVVIMRTACETALSLYSETPRAEIALNKTWNEVADIGHKVSESPTYGRLSTTGSESRGVQVEVTNEKYSAELLEFAAEMEKTYKVISASLAPGAEKSFSVTLESRQVSSKGSVAWSPDLMLRIHRHVFGRERRFDGEIQRLSHTFEEKYLLALVSGTMDDFLDGRRIISRSIMGHKENDAQYTKGPLLKYVEWFNRNNGIKGWYISPEIEYAEHTKKNEPRIEFRTIGPNQAVLKAAPIGIDLKLKVYRLAV